MSNQETNLKVLDFAASASGALDKASQLATAVDQEKQAAAKLATDVVSQLVDNRMLEDHERNAALTKLASHDGAIEVISNLIKLASGQKADYEQKLAAVDQGQSVEENGHVKAAGASVSTRIGSPVNNPNYIGSRAGLGEKKASDTAFARAMGFDA